mmetsp:Transcript_29667/g.57026  ORF Transcript_29667/g.57026 Transcript_29667/m.57026 type:complete len:287 (+) Transcript_29667:58-918(+)
MQTSTFCACTLPTSSGSIKGKFRVRITPAPRRSQHVVYVRPHASGMGFGGSPRPNQDPDTAKMEQLHDILSDAKSRGELWLPESARESQRERKLRQEQEEMEAERSNEETAQFYKDFGVAAEDQLGYEAPRHKQLCPCGGGDFKLPYMECCEPLHTGQAKPRDAVSLCRARYSAYVKKLPGYLVATTHRDNPDLKGGNFQKETESIVKHVKFEKLELVSIENRGADEGFVTFKAGMKGKRGIIGGALQETSRFVREDGVWSYREALNIEFLNTGNSPPPRAREIDI